MLVAQYVVLAMRGGGGAEACGEYMDSCLNAPDLTIDCVPFTDTTDQPTCNGFQTPPLSPATHLW
jgi:hypothetical protein